MAVVVDKKEKVDKKNGRALILKKKIADNQYIQELNVRGTMKAVEDEAKRFSIITDITVKGQQEMQKQRL